MTIPAAGPAITSVAGPLKVTAVLIASSVRERRALLADPSC